MAQHIAGRLRRNRQGALVLILLAVVVVTDQAVKWWAWRHLSWARMNPGGDIIVGRTIGGWYVSPVTGALLDVLDFALLSVAVTILTRCRAPFAVVVTGALMTGGWCSNLLDRLGMHYLTAPGSVRGVVDFIHVGGAFYNVADCFIIFGTPLFLLAVAWWGVRVAMRSAAAKAEPLPARGRMRARLRIPMLAGAGLILAVALGAVNYGGVSAPPQQQPRKTTYTHVRSRPHRPVRVSQHPAVDSSRAS